ncbi:5-formyltetrahydrofolate cyclo-ligase [Psychrobacillus sp. FSL H8-0483]|uniref:5-formyltetrahydrofolate cyclo-ligase n=1 Tax=Psychrobacillus sp. FSL H8-0483 TaxID=2921389 RepID=UPI00315A7346
MTKKEERDKMKAHLSSLKEELYRTYSKEIEQNFLMEETVVNASIIGITISSFPEVNTEGIIQSLWKQGKTVVVPKCTPKDRSMTFYKIESYKQLETVYMQLLEPNPNVTSAVAPSEIDLLVVPGIVYSKTGFRIGYGGGYFDRFLANFNGNTISLAFDFQVVEVVEHEIFDLPIDKIITNNAIIPCKGNRDKDE